MPVDNLSTTPTHHRMVGWLMRSSINDWRTMNLVLVLAVVAVLAPSTGAQDPCPAGTQRTTQYKDAFGYPSAFPWDAHPDCVPESNNK